LFSALLLITITAVVITAGSIRPADFGVYRAMFALLVWLIVVMFLVRRWWGITARDASSDDHDAS
jgi:hypothetical protein